MARSNVFGYVRLVSIKSIFQILVNFGHTLEHAVKKIVRHPAVRKEKLKIAILSTEAAKSELAYQHVQGGAGLILCFSITRSVLLIAYQRHNAAYILVAKITSLYAA